LGVTIRPSSTALAAAGKAIAEHRDEFALDWAHWIRHRHRTVDGLNFSTIERQLKLLVSILSELPGPHRTAATELWLTASEWYGQVAAERGLAAGEVVEEFQHLRELLIRDLSQMISRLPARQSMATVLRLNRFLDEGIAHAVVGYTDRLVETFLNRSGVPVGSMDAAETEIERRLARLELEAERLHNRADSPNA
jgi:hypothetical protein